jgi:hypothetical protein
MATIPLLIALELSGITRQLHPVAIRHWHFQLTAFYFKRVLSTLCHQPHFSVHQFGQQVVAEGFEGFNMPNPFAHRTNS